MSDSVDSAGHSDDAKRWVENWKRVGPILQQIRDEELRQLSEKGVRSIAGHTVYEKNPHQNGMVTMQAWFMRYRLLKALGESQPDRPGEDV